MFKHEIKNKIELGNINIWFSVALTNWTFFMSTCWRPRLGPTIKYVLSIHAQAQRQQIGLKLFRRPVNRLWGNESRVTFFQLVRRALENALGGWVRVRRMWRSKNVKIVTARGEVPQTAETFRRHSKSQVASRLASLQFRGIHLSFVYN